MSERQWWLEMLMEDLGLEPRDPEPEGEVLRFRLEVDFIPETDVAGARQVVEEAMHDLSVSGSFIRWREVAAGLAPVEWVPSWLDRPARTPVDRSGSPQEPRSPDPGVGTHGCGELA